MLSPLGAQTLPFDVASIKPNGAGDRKKILGARSQSLVDLLYVSLIDALTAGSATDRLFHAS